MTETERVLALPVLERRVRRFTSADFRRVGAILPNGSAPTLRPVQLEALSEIATYGGALLPLGVGEGKTLVSFLAGPAAGARRTILIVPSALRQKTSSDYATWNSFFTLSEDLVIVGSSEISVQAGTSLLDRLVEGLEPHAALVFLDEAHEFKDFASARTKRLLRFAERHPGVRFVCASGTLTKRRLAEFAHLSELALGERSPVPRSRGHLDAWSACIDVGGKPAPAHWHLVDRLVVWAGEPAGGRGDARRDAARRAFRRRLHTAPGVVTTPRPSVGASLRLRPVCPDVPQVDRKSVV
jgi:hypothetical protein